MTITLFGVHSQVDLMLIPDYEKNSSLWANLMV